MPKPPKTEYVITRPPAASWWKKNRHKILLALGLVVGIWIGQHSMGAVHADAPQPAPSHVSVIKTGHH